MKKETKKEKNKYEVILNKAIELILIADGDETLYGNSYIEIGERSIEVINPLEIDLTHHDLNSKNFIHSKRVSNNYKLHGRSILK